ncbi:winged helix-turn-helix domain-containing protein [Acidihalobacter ferrooxydans]|uniref:OmpR/PhoB-type domain-containing protein n=1 Tax=Acidihalobacter ferrooxydans TaxID=1765967 RepID=A0A1P8UHW4_9GAMM|nr:winged helix-turn-helix domain-containing protein [Acidihalobacter ferrooxydans]APZ43412.1 hypothetical protein BW247_10170 [Acidihalobacter ferrooxydans]
MTAHTVLFLRAAPGTGTLGAALAAEGFLVHYLRRFDALAALWSALPCQALIAEPDATDALAGLAQARRPQVCLALGGDGRATLDGALALGGDGRATLDGALALPADIDPVEAIARLRALLRRANGYPPQCRVGPLGIDPLRGRASLAGRPLRLPPRELRLLCLLAEHPGQAVPITRLVAALRPTGAVSPSLVPTYIGRLRRQLGPRWIQTLPGIGYRMTPPGTVT